MRSGCPQNQGGAYPAFQHRSNVGSLTSPLDNNVTPVPVVHAAIGIQNNMVATQYPEELKVAYGPAQLQQGNTQSQHFQPHQLESQASTASTECQYPKPGDSVCTPPNSCHQISKKANADFYSSAHVSAQHSSYFGTSATENSARQSVYNGGKQRECSKRNFNGHFPKGSNLNNNTGLQQRRRLNCALSAGTSSAAPLGDGLGMAAHTFPHESNANIELSTNFSDERHCKSQQVKTSPVALNCGQTRTQNLDHSGGTHSMPHQQAVSSPSLSGLPSTDNVSPVGETGPPTDDQILNFIAKKIVYFQGILTQRNRNYGHLQSNKGCNSCTNNRNFTLQSDYIMPKSNSVAHLPTTSTSDKEDVDRQSLNCASIEQSTAAVGQAFEEDTSKASKANAELTKSKETGDCTTSASEKHSTEYPQIMKKVAATCAKNEDESPVVLTAVPEMTLDELTEKHPSLTLNCSSSQEYKPPRLNINKNLDDKDQVPGVSWALKHMTEKEKGDTGLKPVETVGLDNVHGVTQTKPSSVVSENKQLASHTENQGANTKKMKNIADQQHCGVSCKEVIAHSKLNSSIDKIRIHNVVSIVTNQSERLCSQTSCEGVREDEGPVRSQTDLSTALSDNKVIEQASLSESKGEEALSVNTVKDPQYEDISDDEDMSQLAKKLPNTEHEELTFPAGFEDPQYEDISDDENPQTENMSVERPSLTQVPECNNKRPPFENKSSGHVQGQTQMKTEIISDEALIPKKQVSLKTESLDIAQHCSGPCVAETDDGFGGLLCPKCDNKTHLGCQTHHSVSCSPSSVLKDEDETDDEMDDDWLVIRINMSDLKFEPEDEDHDSSDDGETGDKQRPCDTSPTHLELHWPAPQPVPASASSQLEVFDTLESFQQAKAIQFNTFKVVPVRSTPEHEMDSEGESYTPQNRQESYSEPEDSCETEDSCDYSSGSERNYLTVSRQLLKKSSEHLPPRQKLRQLIEAGPKRLSEISKEDDIIILNSDIEDENDQNREKKAKRKRLVSSISEDSGDDPCSQRKKHSPETVDSQYGAVKEKVQIACSDLAHSTEKSGRLIAIKSGSENVQHKVYGQKNSEKEHVIIIDSDSEDDNDQNYKKTNRWRLLSSGPAYGGDASCVQQKRHSSETVDSEYGTANGRIQETRQLIEPKGGSEHVQHKTNTQTTSKRRKVFHDSDKVVKKDSVSKKKVNTNNLLSSVSEDSGDDLFAAQNRPSIETVESLCGTANEKPEKTRLSCDDSPEKHHQCVDEEAHSTLGPNPLIPRFIVQQSSQPSGHLKLLQESGVHRQGKDETGAPKTPTATRKKTDSCEENSRHLYPTNDRHRAVQANVTKSRLASRQLSLPSQEGPSTSISSLSSTRRQLSEARQSSSFSRGSCQSGETSASSSIPKSKQSTSIPRQHTSSSKLQRSDSCSSTSTKGESSSVTVQLSAKTHLIRDWQKAHIPIPRDRKTSLGMEDLRTTNHNLWRDTRPGPSKYNRAPRRRHSSHKSAPPLMKMAKIDAIQLTKATNRDAPREQRHSVGEGYKWSEKPTVTKPTKGSGREGKKCRSPPRPHQ